MALSQAESTDRISRALAHALYLCVDEPDMDVPLPPPPPTKTKSGPRFFPPKGGPHLVEVGVRFGAAFRRDKAAYAAAAAEYHTRTGRAMPPHVRKAHWHRFLVGSRKAEQRSWVVKWIPPILVNAADEELPVVVRPVEAE
jgi:hypothetical protein